MYQERKRLKAAVLSPATIIQAYNLKMKGVMQLAGEKTVIGTVLKKQRVAPIRSQSGIRGMMPKCQALSLQQPRGDDAEQVGQSSKGLQDADRATMDGSAEKPFVVDDVEVKLEN